MGPNLGLANVQFGQFARRKAVGRYALLQLLVTRLLLLDDLLKRASEALVLLHQVVKRGLVALTLGTTGLIEHAILERFDPSQIGGDLVGRFS